MTEETVIYEFSGVTLNEEKLYKRVVLEKSVTITESQFDEACDIVCNTGKHIHELLPMLKIELGF